MPVTAAAATTQPAPLEIAIVGTVEPSSRVEIKSQVAGQIVSVGFTEGQDVAEGHILFEIDKRPYLDALHQAEATVERDRAQIGQTETSRQKDVAQSRMAEADANRYATLAREKIVSEQQNLQFKTAADTANETLRVDQSAIEMARASQKVDEAAVERAKLDVTYCEIRAPISGRLGNLLVHAGNLVKVNDVPLVVINRVDPVFVSFNAPEKYLDTIRSYGANRKLAVEIESREEGGPKTSGVLNVVDNTVDTQTGTIHLKTSIPNPKRVWWPGQFVNARLTLDAARSATVVPVEAVQAGQKGPFVYVVKPDHTVEPRNVSISRTLEREAIVESGVSPGETVVTNGQMLLFPGAHVSVVASPKGDGTGVQGAGR